MCARVPRAAFNIGERNNDTERQQFVEDTALPSPNRNKTLVGAAEYRSINSELEPSAYLYLASV